MDDPKFTIKHLKPIRSDADAAENTGSSPNDSTDEESLVKRMNRKYCVVQDGGKTRVLSFEPVAQSGHGRLAPTFQTFQDFRHFHQHQKVAVGEKRIPRGSWWLNHPERRQYDGLMFRPGAEQECDGRLNLWRGWGVEERPGDWSLMRLHITTVLATGDATSVNYILCWLAWTVQNPAERAQVALVFRGKKGTGKGVLGNALCRIFGQHGLHISSAQHLAGRFNAHLRDTCLLFADEAYWPGEKEAEGSLKRLITEPDLFIEAKGRDGVTVPNMLHIIMASNEDWVVPTSEAERRYAVFEVSDCNQQDQSWFRPLYAQLENGGLEAMLYDLKRMDLGDWHPRQVPRTEALLVQQMRGLKPEDEWWVELLETGTLPGGDPSDPSRAVSNGYERSQPDSYGILRTVKVKGLYDHARSTSPRLRNKSDHALGHYLKEQKCTNLEKVLRRRGWTFPPLLEARAAWEQRFPGWKWRDPTLDAWSAEPE